MSSTHRKFPLDSILGQVRFAPFCAAVVLLTGCTVIPDTFTLRGGTTIFHEEKVKQANFINGEATWRLKK